MQQKKDFFSDVGSRIRHFREYYLHLDQAEFAEGIEENQQKVSRYETGVRKVPLNTIRRIHEKFGMNVTWVLTGAGDPTLADPAGNLVQQLKEKEEAALQYRAQITRLEKVIDTLNARIEYLENQLRDGK